VVGYTEVGYTDANGISIVIDTPELENWTTERLLALVKDKTPEDFTLEFKASESLAKTELKRETWRRTSQRWQIQPEGPLFMG